MVKIPRIEKIDLNNMNISPEYYLEILSNILDSDYDFESKVYNLFKGQYRFYSINIIHHSSRRLICKMFPTTDDNLYIESMLVDSDYHKYYLLGKEHFDEFIYYKQFIIKNEQK